MATGLDHIWGREVAWGAPAASPGRALTPAWRPRTVFTELHAGDRRGAGQRGRLLHLPAQGAGAPRHQQGPALARGECGWRGRHSHSPEKAAGSRCHPGDCTLLPSRTFLPMGPTVLLPKECALPYPPPPSSPGLGRAQVQSLFTYSCEYQKGCSYTVSTSC